MTQRLSLEGTRFIRENSSRPFFLYESHFAVHMPLQAPEDVIEKYRKRNTSDVDPIYCAMVETADTSVGQLLKALDESDQAKDTIVVFFADNGGVRYQAKRPKPVTNNSPLRAGKGHLYEGGIREPLIVRWPGVTHSGAVVHDPVSSIDFLPTLCEAAGAHYPKVDGISLRPLLQGARLAERPLSDQGGKPGGAVRLGDWKLIEFYEGQPVGTFPCDGRSRRKTESRQSRIRQSKKAGWIVSGLAKIG